MSYPATVYEVMIASPSDVATERKVIREVIHEWNSIHSKDRGIVLLPLGWETHSSPVMDERPQSIINKQVLERADLLVATFWTRLGSPTGKSPSGTVEEIEEHLAAGKPAMIYFSSVPVRLDSVDEEQYAALQDFKEECYEEGLVEEYDSITEFKEKFSRQLTLTVLRTFSNEEAPDSESLASSTQATSYDLTDEAEQLLIEASKDKSGTIMRVRTRDGLSVQTNGRDFVESNDPREEARWENAVSQLSQADLIQDRSHKGEVFGVTNEGYRVADLLIEQA